MPIPFAVFTANPQAFHRQLAHFNVTRVAIATPSAHWQEALQIDLDYRLAEGHFLESMRKDIGPMLAGCHGDIDHFVDWFEALAQMGPGQQYLLFDWLARQATLPQMR